MAHISLDNNNLGTIDIEWEGNHCSYNCFFYDSNHWDSSCRLGLNADDTGWSISPDKTRCPGPGTYTLKLEKIDV